MKKNFLSFLIFYLFSINVFSATITIPNSLLIHSISKIFPIKKENTFANIEIKYSNFYIQDNKFKLLLDYESKIILKNFNGNILITSDLKYDEIQKEIYLQDIEIEKITNNNKEYQINNNLILKNIIKQTFKIIENKSFLNLRDNSLTKNLKINDIDIVKNKLLIIF